jgi:hypothetical protein
MTYFPEQRFVTNRATVNREVLLPEGAIGSVLVERGQNVEITDTVVRGLIPDRYIIIDAAQQLGLSARDYEKLGDELLLVKRRTPITADEPIAGRNRERGRRVLAPVSGLVVSVDVEQGRIIMQELPDFIDLKAGVRGRVVRVYEGRGVAIETAGALVQGVWGNGRTRTATMRLEPEEGVHALEANELQIEFKNEVVVTLRPIDADILQLADVRQFAGIVAPSMDAALIDTVLEKPYAVILTEGFGQINMSNSVSQTIREFDGFQVAMDAYLPQRLEPRVPELVINRLFEADPPRPNDRMTLRSGMRVRITRAPYTGLVGRVIEQPERPIALENSLRLPCALVEIMLGERVYVPLANLELAGA